MATTTAARDVFTTLPLEMLQEIVACLDLHSRFKLRTVFKKQQEDIVVDIRGSALENLYVSPNRSVNAPLPRRHSFRLL